MAFPNIVEKTRSQCGAGISTVGIVCLILASPMLTLRTSFGSSIAHVPVATKSTHSASAGKRSAVASKQRNNLQETKPGNQPNLSEVSPEPATVSLKNGVLTVKANNSDLAQILRNISEISGMTIDGLQTSDRIFGVYGPGNPSDVLTALLSGSRYNFVIVGDKSDGAPRKLLLTAKTGRLPTSAEAPTNAPPVATGEPSNAQPAVSEEPSDAAPTVSEESSDESSTAAEDPDSSPSTAEPPPPGVPETGDPEEDRTERVQRMMQRLQAQHDQQQQNAAPQ